MAGYPYTVTTPAWELAVNPDEGKVDLTLLEAATVVFDRDGLFRFQTQLSHAISALPFEPPQPIPPWPKPGIWA